MKCKRVLASLVLLLLLAGCQEQEPAPVNQEGGGKLVSQETVSSSQEAPGSESTKPPEGKAEPYAGKVLQYEFIDFKDDEVFPVIYEFAVNQVQIFEKYTDAGLPEEKFWEESLPTGNLSCWTSQLKRQRAWKRTKAAFRIPSSV